MAISDKVIELSPVNKKKDLIFYIIMGVLLATSVLFLVLYLIKPNAVTGQISGIELSGNLFVEEDGSLTAVKGATRKKNDDGSYTDNAYTICAKVGYSGEIDTSLDWTVPGPLSEVPYDGVTEEDKESSVKNSAGESVGENTQYYYMKFDTPSTAADSSMQISVRPNLTDKNGKSVFEEVGMTVNVRDKGARDIEIQSVTSSDKNVVTMTGSGGNYVLDVPYVDKLTQPIYTVTFRQLPFADKYGRETVITHAETLESNTAGQSYWTDSFLMEKNNDVLSSLTGDVRASGSFSFTAAKKGTSVITLTFNRYNSSEEFDVKITVNVGTPEELGIIRKYTLYTKAVGNTEPSAADALKDDLDIFVGVRYDLPSFIGVTPFSRQASWAGSNVRMSITSDAAGTKPDTSVVERTADTRGGTLALNPKKPGKAYVTLTDVSGNSIGASLTFAVNVSHRVRQFGYSDTSGNVGNKHTLRVVKGASGSLELTYVLRDIFEDVKSSEVNASVSVSKVSGITFDGETDGVVKLTATQKSRTANGVVTMTAMLPFRVSSSISGDDVSVTLTALGCSASSENKLTVTFQPRVEATSMKFITGEDFERIKSGSSDRLIREYAEFVGIGEYSATLDLNMSSTRSPLKLSDLIYFEDSNGNRVDTTADFNAAAGRVRVEGYTGNLFSFVYDASRNPLHAEIFPMVNEESPTERVEVLTLKMEGSDSDLLLKVTVLDNPEKIVYSSESVASEFFYSSLVDENSANRAVNVMPSTVRQMYASGTERSPSDYFVAISVNGNSESDYLYPSQPWYKTGYVYYFENESDLSDFENRKKDPSQDEETRRFARNTALFAVKFNTVEEGRPFDNMPKEVHLLKDLYFYESGKIQNVGFTLYPVFEDAAETNEYNSAFAATSYFLTPKRLIDDLRLDGVDGTNGEYNGYASGGIVYNVALKAVFETGNAGDTAFSEVVYDYSDIRLNDFIEAVEFSGETKTGASVDGRYSASKHLIEFTMPSLVNIDDTEEVTLTFVARESQKTATLKLTVQNKTLGINAVTFYKDAECATAYADGELIMIGASEASDRVKTVYFQVDYPTGANLAEYLQYDTVQLVSTNEEAVVYDVSYNPGSPSANGKYSYVGTLKITARKGYSGKSSVKLTSQVAGDGGTTASSVNLNVYVYVPTSGVTLNGVGSTPTFSSATANNIVLLETVGKDDKPSMNWNLERVSDVALAGQTDGNTYFEVTAAGNFHDFKYDKVSGSIGVVMDRANAVGEKITLTVTEYTPTLTSPLKVNEYVIEITVDVTVKTYDLSLAIDSETPVAGSSYEIVTDGTSAKKQLALSVEFNEGGAQPSDTEVRYVLLKNNVEVAGSGETFSLEKSGSTTYLVYDDSAISLGKDSYVLYAVTDGAESNRIPLALSTTVEYIAWMGAEQNGEKLSISGGEVRVYDTSKTVTLSAGVYNAGTDVFNGFEKVSFAVGDPSKASIDSNGVLTINTASGDFTVTASYGTLPSVTLTVKVCSAVASVTTNFPSQTSSGDETRLTYIYNGTGASDFEFGFGDGNVILLGEGGSDPYTDEYEVSTSGRVFDVTFDSASRKFKLAFKGVGEQSFEIRVQTYPGSGRYLTKTVRVTAVRPVLAATISGGSSVNVNLMDTNDDVTFDIDVPSTIDGYAVGNVTLDLGAHADKFVYDAARKTLTLDKSAFAADSSLRLDATYTFTLRADIGGIPAANAVTLTVKVTASVNGNNQFSSPLFTVKDGEATLSGGATLEFKKSGSYAVTALEGYEGLTFDVYGGSISGGMLFFDSVGSVTVRARLIRYGITFGGGEMTFAVKNEASALVGVLSSGYEISGGVIGGTEIADGGEFAADYDTDKKYVYYTASWQDTGEKYELNSGVPNITADNFTVHFGGGVLTQVSDGGYPFVSGARQTITYKFRADAPGTVSIWATFAMGSRYYSTSVTNATFTMDYKPVSVTAQDKALEPTSAVAATGRFDAPAVTTANGNYDWNNYSLSYELVGTSAVLTVDSDGSYRAILAESDEICRVKLTLTLTSGYHVGKKYETYFGVTVKGEKKLDVSAASPVYLKEGETAALSELVTVDGTGIVPSLSATISSDSNSIRIDGNVITALGTVNGYAPKIKITAKFASDKWGEYTREVEYTLYVLPTAKAENASGGTTFETAAGGEVSIVVSAGNNKVSAVYEIMVGDTAVTSCAQGRLVGNTFYASGEGGTVTVRIRPTIDSEIFGIRELSPVTVTVTVRSLTLKSEIRLAAGGSENLRSVGLYTTSDGVLTNVTSVTCLSEGYESAATLSGGNLTIRDGVNAYFTSAAPGNITLRFRVEGTDASMKQYRGEIEVSITPTRVVIEKDAGNRAETNLTVGSSVSFAYTLISGGRTVNDFCLKDESGKITYGSVNGSSASATYVAGTSGSYVLKAYMTVDGKEYAMTDTYTVTVSEKVVPSVDYGAARSSLALGLSNTYTFEVSDLAQGIGAIELRGLVGATATANGAALQDGKATFGSKVNTVTLVVTASASGNVSFTPVLTLLSPIPSSSGFVSEEYVCGSVTYAAVEVADELTATYFVNGNRYDGAALAATVGDFVSFEFVCGTTAIDGAEVEYSAYGALKNTNGVFTASASGDYSVTASAEIAGKTVRKVISIRFDDPESRPEFEVKTEYGADTLATVTLANDFEIDHAIVTSGNAELVLPSGVTADGNNTLGIVYTAGGNVKILLVARYKKAGSAYDGTTYSKEIEIINNEHFATEDDLTVTLTHTDGAAKGKLELSATSGVNAALTAAKAGEKSLTLTGGEFDWSELGMTNKDVAITAEITVQSVRYGTRKFYIEVTAKAPEEEEPRFAITEDGTEFGLLNLPAGFIFETAFISDNATIALPSGVTASGATAKVTVSGLGDASIVLVGTYSVTGSNYYGSRYVKTLTLSGFAYDAAENVLTVPSGYTAQSVYLQSDPDKNLLGAGGKLTFANDTLEDVKVASIVVDLGAGGVCTIGGLDITVPGRDFSVTAADGGYVVEFSGKYAGKTVSVTSDVTENVTVAQDADNALKFTVSTTLTDETAVELTLSVTDGAATLLEETVSVTLNAA